MEDLLLFLKENNIEYDVRNYGNPYYYNDGFCVQGVSVKFSYDLAAREKEACGVELLERKRKLFEDYLKRHKSLTVGYSGKCGIYEPWYSVFLRSDFLRLKEHENRIKMDTEAFWQREHARRMLRIVPEAV